MNTKKIENIKYMLAVKLAAFRGKAKMTQSEMAAKCNVAQSTYSAIESGKMKSVTIDKLLKMNFDAETGLKLVDLSKM